MKPRILIVDDEARMQRIFEINLSPKYEVLTSGDGEEALKIAKTQNITLMVTDLKMPGMSGMTLLKEARKALPDLPIIIMTAYGTVETAVQAMKDGVVDYILKPIKMDEMESADREDAFLTPSGRRESGLAAGAEVDLWAPEHRGGSSGHAQNYPAHPSGGRDKGHRTY